MSAVISYGPSRDPVASDIEEQRNDTREEEGAPGPAMLRADRITLDPRRGDAAGNFDASEIGRRLACVGARSFAWSTPIHDRPGRVIDVIDALR